MRRLTVFNQVSLDGYFTDARGDMSWAHKQDAEWNAFVAGNAQGDSQLLFGRTTYEMMAAFWPTPLANEISPIVAERMNSLPKIVCSRTLNQASWNNTRLLRGDAATLVRALKREDGPDVAILGSGKLVSSLTSAGLIDEFHVVVNPIVLGSGRTMFEGMEKRLTLRRTNTRAFGNGNVLLCYEPMA